MKNQPVVAEPYQLEKESRKRWLILAMAFLSVIFTFIDRVNIAVAAPGIMKEFRWSPAVMGIVMSAFAWTYVFGQIPGGWVVDKVGLRKSFGWSFAGWGVVTMITSTIGGVFSLSFWRAMLGAVEAPLYPGLVRLLFIWFKKTERAFAMSCLSVALNIGLAAGTSLAALFVGLYGWRHMFLGLGIISLAIVPIWMFLYKEITPAPKKNERQPMVRNSEGQEVRWYHLIKERNVLALTVGYFGVNYSLYLFLNWLPSYFIREWHFPLQKTGLFAAVIFAAGLFGKPFFGWLSGYLIQRGWSVTASRKVLLSALSFLGASIGIVAFAPSPHLAAILLIVAEVTGQASGAICWATAADIAPNKLAAQVGGILNLAAGLGGILAPAATGFMLSATGSFYWPLLTAAGVMVVSAFFYLFVLGKVDTLDTKYHTDADAIVGAEAVA